MSAGRAGAGGDGARRRPPRQRQILEALARELETHPGARITTAHLARVVGVSEAALYRHFPSKAKMFEALIAFAEDSVFQRIHRILSEERGAVRRCEHILVLVLGFAERNPGITRVLLGEALVGEHERLRSRVGQFFDRLEVQLKQVLREEPELTLGGRLPAAAAANLLTALAEGRMAQFSRSAFRRSPLEDWGKQWPLLARGLFEGRAPTAHLGGG